MKEQMKKIALLSLSLILTSAYSVSIVLPSLLQHFSEYTTAQVEMLISAPSFAITVMIVLNAWLSCYMKDRPMIVGGLLLLSVSGMVPVFVQEYPVVFVVDVNEGIVPHHKAGLPADIEEERRLFYVALTRAKERLHVAAVRERYHRKTDVSRFIGEAGL